MSCKEWKKVRFGDVANLITGFPFKGALYAKEGIPVVRGDNVTIGSLRWNDKKCWNHFFDRFEEFSLQEQDIVVGMDGSRVGKNRAKIKKEDLPLLLAQRVACIRSNNKSDQKFLYYHVFSDRFESYVKSIHTGTSIPHISLNQIRDFELYLPSMKEQQRIAAILGALDDKIELNNKINKNLEEQASALFKHWFIDFEFPDANGKPYKSSGGALKDSELGPIPSDWRVGTLENIGNIIGGGTPSKANNDYYTANGIPWITPKDLSLKKLKFISNGETDITDLGYKSSSAKIMPKGSVLFSSRAPIGYISIANNDLCTNQGFKSVVPMKGIGTAFIYLYLKSNVDIIESKASGSTFKEASSSLMKSLDVIIPNQKILDQFNGIGNEHFQQQKTLEAETKVLEHLRNSLLPQLMCNKIKLKA